MFSRNVKKKTIRRTQNFEKGFIDVFAMRVLRGLFQETAAFTCGVVVPWASLKDTQQHQLIRGFVAGVMLRDRVVG